MQSGIIALVRLLVAWGVATSLCQGQSELISFRSDQGLTRQPSAPPSLPSQLGDAARLLWRCPLPPGHSTPCIYGRYAYLTAYRQETKQLVTLAIDLDQGEVCWERVAPTTRLEVYHGTGSPAAASVACDGKRLFVFFGSYGLICYDLAGDLVWKQPLGPYQDEFGSASSPVLVGDLAILNQDHDAHNALIAFHRDTGEVAWHVPRDEFTRSYSTPIIATVDGEPQVIVAGALTLTGYSATSGERRWWFHGLARIVNPTPIVFGDTVYVVSWAPGGDPGERITMEPWGDAVARYDRNADGRIQKSELTEGEVLTRFYRIDINQDGGIDEPEWNRQAEVFRRAENAAIALRLGGRGELTTDRVLWKYGRGLPYVPSPLVYRGVLYLVKDSGILTTLAADSGELIKQGRLAGRGNYYASPVAGADQIYIGSEAGVVSVLRAQGDWDLLSSHDFGETMYATPVVVGNRLYLRTSAALYCFREPAGATQ